MSFSGNFMCTSFKQELLQGKHDFTNGQDTYKLALFTNAAEPTQGNVVTPEEPKAEIEEPVVDATPSSVEPTEEPTDETNS